MLHPDIRVWLPQPVLMTVSHYIEIETTVLMPSFSAIVSNVSAVKLSPIHTAAADETKLSSLVASAVCTRIRN